MQKTFFRHFLFILLILLPLHPFAAVIKGTEPDYAGKELIFKTYTDPITKNEKEVFRINIGNDGSFSETIDINEVLYCQAEFGVYKGLLVVEPESEIVLKLPAFREMTPLESKNPYFKPLLIWLQVESDNSDEINNTITRLEGRYIQLTNQYFNQLYFQRSAKYLDSVIIKLQSEFRDFKNPVIQNQLAFKIKILQADVNQVNQKNVFKGINPVSFSFANPAFSNLLNLVFEDKLRFEANSINGKKLYEAVGRKNIGFIKEYYQSRYNIEPELADFILLKLFHDAYYSNAFNKTSIISILEDGYFSENQNKKIQELAVAVKEKLLFLSPGSKAPVICLNNTDGVQHCSDKIKDYGYLFFADPEMLVCREHLKYLSSLQEKYNYNLDFFIVLKYSERDDSKAFIKENEIPGTVVWESGSNSFAEKYKVRSYPSAFLLNSKHEVILAPAKNPLDGFELEFAKFLRNEQIRKFRNQR